jgi:hypothetical protein
MEERINRNYLISLIYLDLYQHTLKKLHTVEYLSRNIDVIVNKADPIIFLLNDGYFTRICKIVEKTIIIGDRIESNFIPKCFYDKCVYRLRCYERDEDQRRVSLLFTCLVNALNALDTSTLYQRCRKKDKKSIRFRSASWIHTRFG